MIVDGANLFTVFTKLIIPLASPGIAVTSLLSFLFAWNEYLLATTLSSVYSRTIPTGLSEFVTTTGTEWGTMAAVAVVSMLPALIFLVLVQKYIVTGLTFGAVKAYEMKKRIKGFLPIKTNWVDRLFIGTISFVAIQLFWMRFIEIYASINIAIVLGVFWIIYVIWKG